jgi:hypothetical protein
MTAPRQAPSVQPNGPAVTGFARLDPQEPSRRLDGIAQANFVTRKELELLAIAGWNVAVTHFFVPDTVLSHPAQVPALL